jgi:hypothetical protein
MGETERTDCHNLLFTLEGVIRGVRWHLIPKANREELKVEFDKQTRGNEGF